MRTINKVKIFANDNLKSQNVVNELEKVLIKNDFELNSENYDLAIAVGGDGSFLRMIKQNNFNSDICYIGINAGTLGFAQEVNIEEIEDFVKEINNNDFKVEKVGVQQTNVETKESISRFFSLNEIVIRDKNLKTTKLNIKVNDIELEKLIGDGLLVSTSFGSTAYNLSFGGSIVYNELHTLQLTPVAPLNNKAYRSLINSVIVPEDKLITIIPDEDKNDIVITVDGENNVYNDVIKIDTFIYDKTVKIIRRKNYDFSKKINEKFLK